MASDTSSQAALFAALAAGAVVKMAAGFLIRLKLEERLANEYKIVGKVSALYCYPIKSFGGMQVEKAECTALGIRCMGVTDRHWAVATANGVYLTQRQEPSMALIRVQVIGDMMQLDAPGMEPIALPVNPSVREDRLSKITVKTDTITSLDCGDEVADWLCRYFQRDGLRLHYSAPSLEKRDCSLNQKNWNHPAISGRDYTALSDYCGYMVLSDASLAALNNRLQKPVPITNFRANIIVEGCEAFEEDKWISLLVGDVELRVLDSCTRCVLVTVDQEKGIKDPHEEPLSTLKTFRLKEPYGPKPAFGINCTLDKPGTIQVGDSIYAKYGKHHVSPKS